MMANVKRDISDPPLHGHDTDAADAGTEPVSFFTDTQAPISASTLSGRLIAQAYGMGFDAVGIVELGEPATRAAFDRWLAAGRNGSMSYLEGEGAELRRDTRRPHPGATHAIVVVASYGGLEPSGTVARYARSNDYHIVLRERIRELHHWLENETGRQINARPYVDTGPILEKDLAQRAGIGWFGKNSLIITPNAGSFLFIGSLFVEYPLEPSSPFDMDRCGTCTRCLDACPTGAITAPRELDARRCISYLTIELRESIPEALRPGIGSWLFGCDICQDVCPWNQRFARPVWIDDFRPRDFFRERDPLKAALAILAMEAVDYQQTFRNSAIKRAKLWMLQRNACVVLGNTGSETEVPALCRMLNHENPIVREHAEWGIRRIRERSLMRADAISGSIPG